jgi:hypothetical protein
MDKFLSQGFGNTGWNPSADITTEAGYLLNGTGAEKRPFCTGHHEDGLNILV